MFNKKIESIEYRPYPIKELLIRMKDTAMLVVDLAYAALLFKDKDLANEVLELEQEVDTLNYYLQINTMLAARDAKDAEALQSILRIASLTDRISDCAGDIVDTVLKGAEPHPIMLEGLRKMDEPLVVVKVSSNSRLNGKSLSQLRIRTKMGVNIIAIRRENKWIVDPDKTEKIFSEDVLIVRGSSTGVERLKSIALGTGEEFVE
ncbi:potassium channel protein [Candidatus Bathyarchaeota archaeon]|nr:potassium channel protein [Candidatus Bathyarchaeota archaeon]